MTENMMTEGTGNVFEELGFPAAAAERLVLRADLMLQVKSLIETHGWTLGEAATQFGESVERIEALQNGKIGQFQIEQLITMLSAAGMKVRIEVVPKVA
jgi:predicted XRE-type DNA-binding protein